jgi:heme-degrading monooxygenase HmoA
MKAALVPALFPVIAALAASVHAQTAPAMPSPGAAVAAIVKVRTPWYAPRALVTAKMRDTIGQYEALPGLAYKMFSYAQADGDFGGLYLWKDRAAAEAWFNPAWFERVRRERGVEGQVRLFEAPVVLVNEAGHAAGAVEPREAVATLVTLPVPAGVGRERLVGEFRAALPAYRQVAGLKRKYFILTADGRFGGIYLWESRAAADAWFSPAWHARAKAAYGAEAAFEWFDTPILLPSKLAENRLDTEVLPATAKASR